VDIFILSKWYFCRRVSLVWYLWTEYQWCLCSISLVSYLWQISNRLFQNKE